MCWGAHSLRRGWPTGASQMGAADIAARPLLVLDARLERLGRAVSGRVRGRPHTTIEARRRGRGGAGRVHVAKVDRKRAVVDVLQVADAAQLDARRHGKIALRWRGGREGRSVVGHLVAFGSRSRPCRGGVGAPSQGFRGGPRRLLDGTGVVVLMPREGRATSKGLLAVGKRTLVRTLSGMNATMSRERAAVAEGLQRSMVSNGTFTAAGGTRQDLPCHIARTGEASRPCARGYARSERSVG